MTPHRAMSDRKLALITGGARRVGRAVAVHLGERGYDVVVTYRSGEAEARSLQAELAAVGAGCTLVQADLADTGSVARIALAVEAAGGGREGRGLRLLMHNASTFGRATLEQTTPELLREMLALHVETPLLLTARLAPLLKRAGGSVVAMTDLAVERPFTQHVAYSASKAALSNLVLSLARALAPEARANSIAPGAVEWPEDFSEEGRAEYLKRVPLGRVGSPGDVARAVWYLAEEAGYVTGQTIRLDGGRWLG